MGEGYQLLQIESEQSPSPRPTRRYYLGGVLAFSTLVVLAVTLTVSLTSHTSASSHNLEVRPDNTPASKRGAGLLLTYVSCILPPQMTVKCLPHMLSGSLGTSVALLQCVKLSCKRLLWYQGPGSNNYMLFKAIWLADLGTRCSCYCATASTITTLGVCQGEMWKMRTQTYL